MRTELPAISMLTIRPKRALYVKEHLVYDFVPVEINEVSRQEVNDVLSWNINGYGEVIEHNGNLFAPLDIVASVSYQSSGYRYDFKHIPFERMLREQQENDPFALFAIANLYRRKSWREGSDWDSFRYKYSKIFQGETHNKKPIMAANVMDWNGNESHFAEEVSRTRKWLEETVLIVDGNIWIQVEMPRLTSLLSVVDYGGMDNPHRTDRFEIRTIIKPVNPFLDRSKGVFKAIGHKENVREIHHPTFNFEELDEMGDFMRRNYEAPLEFGYFRIDLHNPALVRVPCEAGHLQSVAIDVVDEDFQNLAEADQGSLMAWANLRDEVKRIEASYEQSGTSNDAANERLFQAAAVYQEHCRDERLRSALSIATERWNERTMSIDLDVTDAPLRAFGP